MLAVANRQASSSGPTLEDTALPVRQALQAIRLFSDALSPEQLDWLARQCAPVRFRAGSILMRQGDAASSLICITGGEVRVTHLDAKHRNNIIRELAAGSIVGERELLTGEDRVATVTALTDVDGLKIGKATLDELFARAPEVLESFRATFEIRDAILRQIVPERRGSVVARLVRAARRLVRRLIGRGHE